MDHDCHILDINDDMVAGEGIIDNKVPEYKRNNLLACLNIPDRKRGMGYEELVKFILGHPLSTAFTEGASYVIPQVLLEFWYTCRVEEGSAEDVIIGTVNDGENTIRITPDNLRKILKLPILPKYDPVVSKSQARSVLLEIGNPIAKGVIKKSQFTTKWGFIVSTIVRSLGTKIGSLNNVNDVEMQLLYALVKGRNLDFAQLFFNELKNHVCKKPRDPAAPYSRFVSMCIQDSIGGLYDSLAEMFETVDTPKLTYKMFNGNIRNDEVEMPSTMRFWINNPFQPTSSSFGIAQGVSQDSGKIAKTFSTETLGEKSSKGPRCQETKRVSGVSARQRSPTKRSNDSSRVVNTPKGNDDKYNYDELMEMCGKICLDVDKQAKEIKKLKKEAVYQQKQIDKLKQTVTRMSQRRTMRRFVMKRRTTASHDASKKGESQDTSKKMEDDFEGLSTGVDTKFERESNARFERVIEKDEQVLESSAPEVKKKDDDNDKKGESTKRRRKSDNDDSEEGETGYKRYKRTKRKIIDEETQPQPPEEQLSQPIATIISLETPQIVMNQGIENNAIKNKYPLASETSSKAVETAEPTLSQKEREAVEALLHVRRIITRSTSAFIIH